MNIARRAGSRIAMLRGAMRTRGIDAMLIVQRENIRYLTGFSGSAGCLIIGPGRPVLVTDFRYEVQAGRETSGLSILIQKKDQAATVAEAAERLGVRELSFDKAAMTVERAGSLRRKGLRLRGVKDPVGDLRQCKDRHELGSIRRAIRRAEESFRELEPQLRPGMNEREIGLRLEWLMREKGSHKAAFDTIVASGPNGAMPHASISGRKIRRGDMVTVDFGAEADGYFCDLTRTICVGRPDARQREISALVLKAQQTAISAIAPGVACRVVDKAARGVIEGAGYGKCFGHATGHGVGMMVHEAPALSAQSTATLAPGMVVTVEPGIYIPGWGGVRIEDMVLVTERGALVLSTLDRGL